MLAANGLIAYLAGAPGATDVRGLLEGGRAAITTLNLAEAVDVLARRFAVAPARTRSLVDPLLDGALSLLPVEARQAWRAGELRAAHYDRRSAALSLADCILLAAAETADGLATSDSVVARVARSLGLEIVPLPDSGGRRPA